MTQEHEQTIEKTQELQEAVSTIMREKADLVDVLTGNLKERRIILKELLMTSYITGFFEGVKNAAKDVDRHQN